jgi:cytochrome c5
MRKIPGVMLLGIATVLIAAGSAVFAQLQSGSYGSTKASSIGQNAATQISSDGNFAVVSFPSFAPELAEGEGRAEAESFCAMCHSTRYITMQPPLPAATWEAEVNKMTKTFGAPIPEGAAKKIISYLQTHYTPETRKQ